MIINVNEISDLQYGGKAYGLNKLINYGVKVPEAFVINQSFIDDLINENKNAIQEIKSRISKFPTSARFAVRSSAANEDGDEKSFAGMYESILNVENNVKVIIYAVCKVNNSLSSKRIESYNKEKAEMNIVIQKMINPILAGVCFTEATDLNGDKVAYIEYVEGLGEKLVSGKETAKNIVVKLNDYSCRFEDISVSNEFKDLLYNLRKIIEKSDEPLDLEWCIDENGTAYFVQARPITRDILVRNNIGNGAIASSGKCEGIVYIIDEDEEDEGIERKINNFPTGAILVAKTTDTNYVPAMKKASGIITTEGSILSHAAIIAREFGIPCITGFKGAFNTFKNGKKLLIDTNKQVMNYDGKNILFGEGKEINLLELYVFDNIIVEYIDGNMVLVECVDDEFGIHIDEELEQQQIDMIEKKIRIKYKRAPIILKDQKYLWYTEYKRFLKFPEYYELTKEVEEICRDFDVIKLNDFVEKIMTKMAYVYDNSVTKYDKLFASEYAQAMHFLINLYMCNGIAMKYLNDYAKKQGINSIKELLSEKTIQGRFLKRIESIREGIWEQFVKNKWSNDDYFDVREQNMMDILSYNDEDTVVDYFYNTLEYPNYLSKYKNNK